MADGGLLSNVMLMGQLALTLGVQGWAESMKTKTDLQPQLDKIRPALRELSKRVVWLPQPAESLIGAQLLRIAPRPPYSPANDKQKKFVSGVMAPIFRALQGYAVDELKTPMRFRMQLFLDDAQQSPEMVAGGTLLVPSGMVKTLAGRGRDSDQVVAFMFAHEFSHALRRHLTKSTQTRLVDGLLMANVFKTSFQGFPNSLDAANNLGQVFDLSRQTVTAAVAAVCAADQWFSDFDQKQELEADVCGALLLSKLPRGTSAERPAGAATALGRAGVVGAAAATGATGTAGGYDALEGLRQYRAIMKSMPPPAAAANRLCVVRASHPDTAEREKNLADYQSRLTRSP